MLILEREKKNMQTCQRSEGCDIKKKALKLILLLPLSHTHTYVSTRIHYPPPSPPSPRSRGCWSEKLNFSDEKVFPAPIPLLPFSPPIHSLIYSLIYELLIYSLREKLTVVQLSVRAAAVFAMEDHQRRTGLGLTLAQTQT